MVSGTVWEKVVNRALGTKFVSCFLNLVGYRLAIVLLLVRVRKGSIMSIEKAKTSDRSHI